MANITRVEKERDAGEIVHANINTIMFPISLEENEKAPFVACVTINKTTFYNTEDSWYSYGWNLIMLNNGEQFVEHNGEAQLSSTVINDIRKAFEEILLGGTTEENDLSLDEIMEMVIKCL